MCHEFMIMQGHVKISKNIITIYYNIHSSTIAKSLSLVLLRDTKNGTHGHLNMVHVIRTQVFSLHTVQRLRHANVINQRFKI